MAGGLRRCCDVGNPLLLPHCILEALIFLLTCLSLVSRLFHMPWCLLCCFESWSLRLVCCMWCNVGLGGVQCLLVLPSSRVKSGPTTLPAHRVLFLFGFVPLAREWCSAQCSCVLLLFCFARDSSLHLVLFGRVGFINLKSSFIRERRFGSRCHMLL